MKKIISIISMAKINKEKGEDLTSYIVQSMLKTLDFDPNILEELIELAFRKKQVGKTLDFYTKVHLTIGQKIYNDPLLVEHPDRKKQIVKDYTKEVLEKRKEQLKFEEEVAKRNK